ncbi:MAG: VOC family protein [Xenococcaceae cyanobacterium MO_167.B52]|nr:VOC family protein [Xenococcaceae cyanobacterium MO_167.B52]
MAIRKCVHTAILVSDLDKAQAFYGDILGLEESPERAFNFPGIWYQIGNYQIHLIHRLNFTNSIVNEAKWGRNPHLALETDDLANIIAKLRDHNYPVQMSASGRKALFTQDPDGNIIEISQMSSND